MTDKALNPSLQEIEAWLREDESATMTRRELADKLGYMSWAGALRGMVEDIGADEVLLLGALERYWPFAVQSAAETWRDSLELERLNLRAPSRDVDGFEFAALLATEGRHGDAAEVMAMANEAMKAHRFAEAASVAGG